MNVSKSVERAFGTLLRQFAQIGEGTVIRLWQSLAGDTGTWSAEKDRTFPVVDIRCSPPRTDDNEETCYVDCAIICGTKADDDKDHSEISELYGEVQGVIDALYGQRREMTGEEWGAWSAILSDDLGNSFSIGGMTFGDALSPYIDGGINMLGVTVRVHYGRADY